MPPPLSPSIHTHTFSLHAPRAPSKRKLGNINTLYISEHQRSLFTSRMRACACLCIHDAMRACVSCARGAERDERIYTPSMQRRAKGKKIHQLKFYYFIRYYVGAQGRGHRRERKKESPGAFISIIHAIFPDSPVHDAYVYVLLFPSGTQNILE